ncbi:MAG TPA: 4a-hydroxytetrahydrobiopterin dehydratase, partial [Acidimicrobiales bacterium]
MGAVLTTARRGILPIRVTTECTPVRPFLHLGGDGFTIRLVTDATPAGWEVVDGKLHRELTFKNFSEAWAFMARVALAAEKADHHPDWSNSWNR